jgi:hypothetical protein
VDAVTSLHIHQTSPTGLAGWLRGHGGIEALHHLRDVTDAQDAATARTGSLPRVMASLRNPWPSARCGWPATPTSPQRYDIPAATLPGRLPSSAWQPHETDITPL